MNMKCSFNAGLNMWVNEVIRI